MQVRLGKGRGRGKPQFGPFPWTFAVELRETKENARPHSRVITFPATHKGAYVTNSGAAAAADVIAAVLDLAEVRSFAGLWPS